MQEIPPIFFIYQKVFLREYANALLFLPALINLNNLKRTIYHLANGACVSRKRRINLALSSNLDKLKNEIALIDLAFAI